MYYISNTICENGHFSCNLKIKSGHPKIRGVGLDLDLLTHARHGANCISPVQQMRLTNC